MTVHDPCIGGRGRTPVRGVVAEVVVRDGNSAVAPHRDHRRERLLVAERDARRRGVHLDRRRPRQATVGRT